VLVLAFAAGCSERPKKSALFKENPEGAPARRFVAEPDPIDLPEEKSTDPKPAPRPSTSVSSKPASPASNWPKKKRGESRNPFSLQGLLEIAERGDLFTFFTRPFAQAFGHYDRGTLAKPDALKDEGDGYLKLFRQRDRAYGTLDLVTLVGEAAQALRKDYPAVERLQIGDVSAKLGGPVGGHGSHQNGLDVDVVFLRRDRREMNPRSARANETGFDEDFVDAKGRISSNFDTEANWRLIELLVSTGRVDRIFVDQNIKREFCEYAAAKGRRADWTETLRKLRHWENHQDHLHLRLTCPASSNECKTTPPIPAGDGCDRLLDRTDDGAGFILPDLLGNPDHSPNERGC
jgi:penicillin-insensitive murein endopeptidase